VSEKAREEGREVVGEGGLSKWRVFPNTSIGSGREGGGKGGREVGREHPPVKGKRVSGSSNFPVARR